MPRTASSPQSTYGTRSKEATRWPWLSCIVWQIDHFPRNNEAFLRYCRTPLKEKKEFIVLLICLSHQIDDHNRNSVIQIFVMQYNFGVAFNNRIQPPGHSARRHFFHSASGPSSSSSSDFCSSPSSWNCTSCACLFTAWPEEWNTFSITPDFGARITCCKKKKQKKW